MQLSNKSGAAAKSIIDLRENYRRKNSTKALNLLPFNINKKRKRGVLLPIYNGRLN
jgi:hypothetical protein